MIIAMGAQRPKLRSPRELRQRGRGLVVFRAACGSPAPGRGDALAPRPAPGLAACGGPKL